MYIYIEYYNIIIIISAIEFWFLLRAQSLS
jgi:hypothetical protein